MRSAIEKMKERFEGLVLNLGSDEILNAFIKNLLNGSIDIANKFLSK